MEIPFPCMSPRLLEQKKERHWIKSQLSEFLRRVAYAKVRPMTMPNSQMVRKYSPTQRRNRIFMNSPSDQQHSVVNQFLRPHPSRQLLRLKNRNLYVRGKRKIGFQSIKDKPNRHRGNVSLGTYASDRRGYGESIFQLTSLWCSSLKIVILR